MNTGFKTFSREILQRIELGENRFGFDPEITAKLLKIDGVRLYEVPISYRARSRAEGKKIGWRDALTVLRCIVKYSSRRASQPR